MKIGIVGAGYWGPNYVRIFSQTQGIERVLVHDVNHNRACYVAEEYMPIAEAVGMLDDLVEQVDAVVLATPAGSHYSLATDFLCAGKHVLCEKPVTTMRHQHTTLFLIAKEYNRVLFPGLTYLFHPAIQYIRDVYIRGNHDLGEIKYFKSTRTNYGPIRQDVPAFCDLAPHDISIAAYLFGTPKLIGSFLEGRDSAHLFLNCRNAMGLEIEGTIHTSWLEPGKRRELRIVFEHGMIEYDDTTGELWEHRCPNGEYRGRACIEVPRHMPLDTQCDQFLAAIKKGSVDPELILISQSVASILEDLKFAT